MATQSLLTFTRTTAVLLSALFGFSQQSAHLAAEEAQAQRAPEEHSIADGTIQDPGPLTYRPLAIVLLDDYSMLCNSFEQCFLTKLWNSDDLLALREELRSAADDWMGTINLSLGLLQGEVSRLAIGEVAVLISQHPNNEVGITVLIEAASDHSGVSRLVQQIAGTLDKDGAVKLDQLRLTSQEQMQLKYRQQTVHIGWTCPQERFDSQSNAKVNGRLEGAEDNPVGQEEDGAARIPATIICISSHSQLVVDLLERADDSLPSRSKAHSPLPHSRKAVVDRPPLHSQASSSLLVSRLESALSGRLPENFQLQPQALHAQFLNPNKSVNELAGIDHLAGIDDLLGNISWHLFFNCESQNSSVALIPRIDGAVTDPDGELVAFEGVDSASGSLQISAQKPTAAGEMLLRMKGPKHQGIFELLSFSSLPTVVPSLKAGKISHYSLANWNIPRTVERLGELYEQLMQTPNAFDKTMIATKEELAVDLRNDLFPILGPGAVVVGIADDQLSTQQTLVILDIQQPDQNAQRVAEMISRLFAEDTESVQEQISGQSHPLWRISFNFSEAFLASGEGDAPTQLGVIVSDGRLWCSTNAEAISATLSPSLDSSDTGKDPARTTTTEIRQLIAKLNSGRESKYRDDPMRSNDSSDGISMLSVVDWDRFLSIAYHTLRNQGPGGTSTSPDFTSRMIATMLGSIDRLAMLDFSKLPPYSQVGPNLGGSYFQVEPHLEGWRIVFQLLAYPDGP